MDKTTRFTASLLLLVGGFVLFNGFEILKAQNYLHFTAPISLILVGILVFVLGIFFGTDKMPASVLSTLDRVNTSMRIRQDQLVMLVLSVIMAIIAQLAAGYGPKMTNPFIAVLAWSTALIFVVAGSWKKGEAGKYPPGASLRTCLETPLTLVGIFIFALLFRIIQPESIPVLLSGDEGSSGLAATQFARGETNNIFRTDWYSFPALYFTIPGLIIRVLGQTVTALRLSSAIPGALTVVAVFWIVHAAFGKRAAWFAAIFLSTLHFHVHFSRIALNNIWDGLWVTVGLSALWYAWNYERRNAYILAGLCLGLSQYFYTSGRILVFIMLVWLVIVGLSDRPRLKRALPDLGLMALTAIVVTLPLFIFFVKYPLELVAPLNRVGIFSREWLNYTAQTRGVPTWRILLDQVMLGLGAYIYAPVRAWYYPEIPILRPSAAAFFVSGLAFSLIRNQKKFGYLLVLWLIAFGLLGAMSESTPAAQRYPAAAPAVAILVAVGVSEYGGLLERLWPSMRNLVSVATILTMLLLAAREVQFYFFQYTPKSAQILAQDNSMVGYRLGLYLRRYPKDAVIVFLGGGRMGFYSIPSTQYLAPQFNGIDINTPWSTSENLKPNNDHLLFIILPNVESDIPLVQHDYPGGILSKEYSTDGTVLFYVYEYNAHSIESITGAYR